MIFGCALPVTVTDVVEVPATTPVNRLPSPLKKLAVTRLPKLALPEVILPVTTKLVRVPVDVILGCALVVTAPAVVAVAADPVIFPVIVAVTVNPVNVPVLVIFG